MRKLMVLTVTVATVLSAIGKDRVFFFVAHPDDIILNQFGARCLIWSGPEDGNTWAEEGPCRRLAELLKELKPRAVCGHHLGCQGKGTNHPPLRLPECERLDVPRGDVEFDLSWKAPDGR